MSEGLEHVGGGIGRAVLEMEQLRSTALPDAADSGAIRNQTQTTGAAATVHTRVSVTMTATAVPAIRPATRHRIGNSHDRCV